MPTAGAGRLQKEALKALSAHAKSASAFSLGLVEEALKALSPQAAL